MRPFLTSKRKLIDLVVVSVLIAILWPTLGSEAALLFGTGFIWNWVASQDLSQYMAGKSYRYTMLRLVLNLQALIQTPPMIKSSPEFIKVILRSLPAGLFWWAVIWFQDSDLPVWATFAGSLVFELSQWEVFYRKKEAQL
jgi:hypothetical protein